MQTDVDVGSLLRWAGTKPAERHRLGLVEREHQRFDLRINQPHQTAPVILGA
jgi:hypothetical protein